MALFDLRNSGEVREPPPDGDDNPISLPDIDDLSSLTQLKDLNLEQQLLMQYQQAQALYNAVRTDRATPLNQKAQMLGTMLRITSQILSLQQELHNIETLKLLESTLVETLKEFPEISGLFMARYEAALAARSSGS